MPVTLICPHGVTPKRHCLQCHREISRRSARKRYDPAKNRAFYENNRDNHLVTMCNRRARNLGAPGEITVDYWLSIKERCAYCGTTKFQIQIEHRVPLSRGGTNYPDNVQGVCSFCNRAKGAQTEAEFLAWLYQLDCSSITKKKHSL